MMPDRSLTRGSDGQERERDYTAEFYAEQVDGSVSSARLILGMLYEVYRPGSVIDVGCGRGGWLATAESLGTAKLRGMDGPWVNPEALLSPRIEFTPVDFERDIECSERYDLCISVEVAEHLPESRAAGFVRMLCGFSDVVMFSAAIPKQGGTYHVNEQWQSYWIECFDAGGYECLDVFRPVIWRNVDIQWWYRQNLFLFVRRDSEPAGLVRDGFAIRPITDVVHPENYEKKIAGHRQLIQCPDLRFCLDCMTRYLAIKLRRLLGAGGDR